MLWLCFSFHSIHTNTYHPPTKPRNRSKKGIPEAVDFIFCVGDDRTDEDMFQVLKIFRQVNSLQRNPTLFETR